MYHKLLEDISAYMHGNQETGADKILQHIEDAYSNDQITGSQYDHLKGIIEEWQ